MLASQMVWSSFTSNLLPVQVPSQHSVGNWRAEYVSPVSRLSSLPRFMSAQKSWDNLKSWKIMSAVLKELSGPGDQYMWGLWSGQGLYLLSLMSFSWLLGQCQTSRDFSGNLSSLPSPAKKLVSELMYFVSQLLTFLLKFLDQKYIRFFICNSDLDKQALNTVRMPLAKGRYLALHGFCNPSEFNHFCSISTKNPRPRDSDNISKS